MTNEKTAKAFAAGKTKGKALHMFIDGDTIYSYGQHFPIARRADQTIDGKPVILITTRTWRRTTARHMACVYSALSSHSIIEVDDVSVTARRSTLLADLDRQADAILQTYDRSRLKSPWQLSQYDRVEKQIAIVESCWPVEQIAPLDFYAVT